MLCSGDRNSQDIDVPSRIHPKKEAFAWTYPKAKKLLMTFTPFCTRLPLSLVLIFFFISSLQPISLQLLRTSIRRSQSSWYDHFKTHHVTFPLRISPKMHYRISKKKKSQSPTKAWAILYHCHPIHHFVPVHQKAALARLPLPQ